MFDSLSPFQSISSLIASIGSASFALPFAADSRQAGRKTKSEKLVCRVQRKSDCLREERREGKGGRMEMRGTRAAWTGNWKGEDMAT